MRYAFLFSFIMMFISPVSQAAPFEEEYDIRGYCERIMAITGNTNDGFVMACMKEEGQARVQLRQMDIPEAVLDECMALAHLPEAQQLGGSYTLTKTCIDQEMESYARYNDGVERPAKKSTSSGLFDHKFW